jgi:molecular chaperone DnaK
MSHAIGIDLGTTNSVVAAVVDGVAVTLADEEGRRLLPSVVSFHPSGTVLVGDSARERRLIDPDNTIYSVKPLMGRTFDSDAANLARRRLPFRLAQGDGGSITVLARDVAYGIPEISAFVLRRAKAIAERALGGPVERAVITVPANFNDLQRASTKVAGKLAGLDVLRILNEPTAAALAYGQTIAKAEKIAIYDLGGGTFDVTLLDLAGNVFEVIGTAGDSALGGDDIDNALAERLSLEVIKRFNFDPRSDRVAFSRLKFLAEEAKKRLSTAASVEQELTGIGYAEGGVAISTKVVVTREELERIALPLLERTLTVSKQCLDTSGYPPSAFDRVLLVGGSTRMPLAGRLVEKFFGRPPNLDVNPDEVVALGAAIQANALNRSRDRKKKSPGEISNAHSMPEPSMPKAAPVPVGITESPTPQYIEFSKAAPVITFSPPPPAPRAQGASPPQTEDKAPPGNEGAWNFFSQFNPPAGGGAAMDLAFARGSAIATSQVSPLLIDVTPLSLRIETVGGFSDVLISANSAVPCEKARTFLTASDNQTTVQIRVAQGESARFSENTRLGELELSGLKPAPRGEVKVLVTFELDADGILNVRAKDPSTNRETKATMRLLGASTDANEMEGMMARQARHAVA